MQRILALILITALIIPASMKVGVMVGYVLQYDAYVKVLCENKDKPALKCNGKCHLSKELAALDEASTDPESPTVPGELQKELVFTFFSIHADDYEASEPVRLWGSFLTSTWSDVDKDAPLPPPRRLA